MRFKNRIVLVTGSSRGIGKATARSITVYAFNEPHVFIETNVRRVFIHHFFKDKENISDSDLLPYIEQTLDQKSPREWYWALMDYGTYLASIIENPNRKSKHYAKQSKFEGSVRKIRGEILKELLLRKSLLKEQLESKIQNILFKEALEGLIKDKLVINNKNTITLS